MSTLIPYALQQIPKVQRVDPSLRHWMLYTPWHVKMGLKVRVRNWKKFEAQPEQQQPVRVRVITPSVEGLAGGQPSFLNVPETRTSNGAVLFIHGGGHLRGVAEPDQPFVKRLARAVGVAVLSVAYRSAEEEPFPADLDDCYVSLRWLQMNTQKLGIDPAKIAVVGKSAGGGLAAALVQKALDSGHPVGFQGLLYPMLDDRTALRDEHEHRGEFFWSDAWNKYAWNLYLGEQVQEENAPKYAAPARRENYEGLPNTWLGVGTLDLFHPECLTYAQNLHDAGVQVQTIEIPGMFHGADLMFPQATASLKLWNSLFVALEKFFAG
ncbi:alpha/beta hydrolase [Rothia sp. ZJ1223]|uniref:alpha/beta hydrolase n=1 Tax=Rothia sp. ZJ1223 TaxID=2811098 RepID=UPI00195F0962|nr:alpha/beta hydrolase [Rothia sp. ZJ1223]MBM7051325.1 alpha/beta hydrolase [Rothia sp. ZJ1223]